MHWQDHLGARRDGCLNPAGINVVGSRHRLYRNRDRATLAHRQPGSDIGVRRDNHLVPSANPQGEQRQTQRIQAVGNAHAIPGIRIGRKLLLEGFHILPADVPARAKGRNHRRLNLSLNLAIGRTYIQKGAFILGSVRS
jgi:hypothetical protein